MQNKPLSVGRLLDMLRQSMGRAFASILVTGEVIDPLVSARGHLYFRLSDGQSEIKAVMWRSDAARLRSELRPGDLVTVRGKLDVYPQRGDLQLVATALMQSGRGEKLLALSELRRRLKAEGLFDRERRQLPPFPKTIGVVTSVSGAVIHDIYQSVQKRFPSVQLLLSPSAVSGENAPQELCRALARLEGRVETVIIARGGGSFEELLPFSDEALLRLVASFSVPVVAAVGHGSDDTLLDHVADHTAPTPTAAAVLATPDGFELSSHLDAWRHRASRAMGRRLQEQRQTLAHTVELCRSRHPLTRLLRQKERLAELKRRLQSSQGRTLENRRHRLLHLGERIRVLGPKTLLSRGLAMIYAADGLVTGIGGRTKGEELELHFADGRIVTEITRVEPLQS